ncbi:FecR domain-containing protein [Alistipes sp. OttesenSCG-928-B03]|nr:FecR domain-containing protein [Alistipes sp. OttesenSCG-928-B03]
MNDSHIYKIAELLAKKQLDIISDDERETLLKWVGESEENAALFESLGDSELPETVSARYRTIDAARYRQDMELRIRQAGKITAPRKRARLWRAVAASAAVIAVAVGVYTLSIDSGSRDFSPFVTAVSENSPILHFENNRIPLEDVSVSIVGGQFILSKADGTTEILRPERSSVGDDIAYSTISTPVGKVAAITLEDGTEVWLNSNSRLKSPVVFGSDSREVELDGEAFFKVAPDASKPFIVSAKGQQVEVLGTEFNVKAYPDQRFVYTTLLEGSVQVSNGAHTAVLSPGTQTVAGEGGLDVHKVNARAIIGWTNHMIVLEGQSLGDLMSELGGLYGFEVEYKDEKLKDIRFKGLIPHYETFEEVVEVLELTKEITVRNRNGVLVVMAKAN